MVPAQTRNRPVPAARPRRSSANPGPDGGEEYQTHVSHAVARRRAVSLLAMSVVLPGTAQIVAGHRGVGRIVLKVWLGLLTIAVLLGITAYLSLSTVVGLVSAPWFLALAQWVLYGWAAVWALVLLDAWRLGRPASQPTRTRRRFAIATVVLLLAPAGVAYAGASVSAGRAALGAVFGGGPTVPPVDGRYNILLLGGDSGEGREGTRPDSLQLVSIDADSGRAVTFGFARDTSGIVFEKDSVMAGLMPDGWTCGDDCLLNGLYTWAWDHADEFPDGTGDPGILATREAVEALSGLEVQYHAVVDMNGFRSLIDALGGLEITVMRRTPIGGGTSPIFDYIEPGTQRLDGYHALWYARSREGSTNYERMARQRCVISAMVDQVDPRTLALRFGEIASASTGVLTTDIPQSELGNFAELALKTRSQKITGVNFVPPLLEPWDFEQREMHRIVEDTLEESEDTAEAEAVSTSVDPLPTPGASSAGDGESTGAGEGTAPHPATSGAPGTSETPETPAYDPLAKPSEDAFAKTDDIASVCSVG